MYSHPWSKFLAKAGTGHFAGKAKDCQREDKGCGVKTTPPKTEINRENKRYLQLLDAFEDINKAPVDVENPYNILANHIRKNNLKYETLLYFADRYYNRKTILRIAHTASQKEEII